MTERSHHYSASATGVWSSPALDHALFTECIEQNLTPEEYQTYIEEQIAEAGGHEVGDVTIKIQIPRTPMELGDAYWMVEVLVNINGQFTCDRNMGETYYHFDWTTSPTEDLSVANIDCKGLSAGECCLAARAYRHTGFGVLCAPRALDSYLGGTGGIDYQEYVFEDGTCDQVQLSADTIADVDAITGGTIARAIADLDAFATAPICTGFEGLLEKLYDAAVAIRPLSQTIGDLACSFC
jgi:hypothetical protein